nr:MATE family efflux transporter [Lachnospiraceae bacterium]
MTNIAVKKNKQKEIDFTVGSPIKLILSFFWPLLLTSMFQQFYNFADTWMVGKGLGDNALAAVGNMGTLFFLIVGFSVGLANGFGVLIAQSYGAKDFEELKHRLGGVIVLGVNLSLILSVVSVMFLPAALRLLRTNEIIMGDSLLYGYIVFGGLFSSICYNVCGAILRAFGDSKTPLNAIIVSSLVNLGLDYLLIFVLRRGVEGAAIATVFAQLVSSAICIARLIKMPLIKLERKYFINESKVYVELLANGLPMAFMNSITAVGCMVVQGFVNAYGVAYTAAYAACSKYLNLFMNPAMTAGNAMSAYTSQNYGAKEYHRIKDGLLVCLGISIVSYLLLGGFMYFKPEILAGFLLTGQEQIALVCEFLPACGIAIIFVDCLFVVRSAVQGMGKQTLPTISGVAEMVIRILVITTLMGNLGFMAAAYAEIGAWLGALLINGYALYRELTPLIYPEKAIKRR